ncbi:MAG: DNA polymerase III subunit alpha [Gammaproteobacteria bacterium]|nr:DNA polymerase III subunit alpha [Gammaproteobacteria bacterium]
MTVRASSSKSFVHLHLHSEYSLADGLVRLKPLANELKERRQPAIALTDISNLYGVVKFYKACLSKGIKPLVGADVWIEDSDDITNCNRGILLCKDNQGYKNLSRLITDAYLRGQKNNRVILRWAQLQELREGLLFIMDEHEGALARLMHRLSDEERISLLHRFCSVFGDNFYLGISRIGRSGEDLYIQQVVQIAEKIGVPLVANNRVEFIHASDFDAHEIRVCINDGRVLEDSRRPRKFTNQQYLRSAGEMHELFADIPESTKNTVEIAKRCNLFLNFDEDYLPDYPDTNGRPVSVVLRQQTEDGLSQRLGVEKLRSDDGQLLVGAEYIHRMDVELGVIEEMGFPGYFLIVADFIRWARANDIPVGPGRGSGAGSLVAWATGITELDPLLYGLLFERFLNPDRVSLPDFDIDFCVDGRDRVIEYVAERYGQDQVAQIITFGTMAAKAVVRDVGRVMSLPYGFVDQVAKLIPFEIGITLQKALDQEEVLRLRYEEEEDITELIDTAMQLEGIARNVGKHAGGVVIAPKALTEYTPLYADTHLNQAITQLDKDDLESIGLVKFDFLGLRTLTIIHSAKKFIDKRLKAQNLPPLDLDNIPLNDDETFKLIQQGKTTAIFQLESRGMKELVIRLRPDTFDHLVALVALFRPGPLQSGMVEDFINRKHGRESIKYPHPDIEPVLNTTYGVILYQEQVMQIAQVLAGYTLGGADLLRRAMGKKKAEEMEKQRALFTTGSVGRGVDADVAEYIFDLMEKFAGYGFNKSHSVAYALVSYQTAWLKTHYPAEYMAATLSADLDNTDKVVSLLADCSEMGIRVEPPDVNSCDYGFKPVENDTILYGIGAVKRVGRGVVESIVDERNANGVFDNLLDLCCRLDTRKVNKRVLEALIKSGAMDQLGEHRAALLADVNRVTQTADQQYQNKQVGQFDMFGIIDVPTIEADKSIVSKWSEEERLAGEKETLGLYLTGHPFHRFSTELSSVASKDITMMDLSKPKNAVFAGLIIAKRVLNTRRGKMAFITLDNSVDRIEVSLFSEKLKQNADILNKDSVLIAQGELSADEFSGGCQMRVDNMYDLDQLRLHFLQRIRIVITESKLTSATFSSLKSLLTMHQGGSAEIAITYERIKGEVGELTLGNQWRIKATQLLVDQLQEMFGLDSLGFKYDVSSIRNGIQPASLVEAQPISVG